jgi:hypothetical protein
MRALATLLLLTLGACATRAQSSAVRVVVFNEAGGETRVSIEMDGTNIYAGCAGTAAAVEPNISFSVARPVDRGNHTISVYAGGRQKSQTFTSEHGATIEVRITSEQTSIIVYQGTRIYIWRA